MQFFGAAGLAAGNVCSAGVQALLLTRGLRSTGISGRYPLKSTAKICASALAMALICHLGFKVLSTTQLDEKGLALVAVSALVPLGASSFFGFMMLAKADEAKLLKNFLKRKLQKNPSSARA